MKAWLTSSVVIIWGGAASALSCLPTSVELLYTNAAEATEAYIPAVGFLTSLSLSPKAQHGDGFASGQVGKAMFHGHYVDGSGNLVPWTSRVTAETFCAASWCGDITAGVPYLTFLRVEGRQYHFDAHACSTSIANPNHEEIEQLQACMRGAECTPEW